MKPETFFEKFELFVDAPDAVAKMRELVFQLAVQGRLVQQDQSEEPATILLRRIHAARAALPTNRRSGDETDTLELDDEPTPFDLPPGWVWTSLGKVQFFTNGYAFKSEDYQPSGVGIIRMGELGANGEIDETNMKYVSTEIAQSLPETFRVKPGDLLMGMSGSIGKLAINRSNKTYLLNQRVGRLDPILIEKTFLQIFLKTVEQHYLRISFGMAIKNLSTKQINETPFPLPPLPEQKRIVAKVDELMALCRRLEAQQQERETRHVALARASLDRFTEAPTLANLRFLFHKSYTINPADLRKSIITLAVQGKLLSQEPAEETKSVEAIGGSACVREEETPFNLPESWKWSRVGAIGRCSTGRTPPTNDPSNYGVEIPFIGPGQMTLAGTLLPAEKFLSQKGLKSAVEAKEGDVLMVCIGGSIGKSVICRERLAFNQQINGIRPFRLTTEFTFIVFNSEFFQQKVLESATGSATPIINRTKWENIPVPVPPLAEQRRIVEKVDQLMALISGLETELSKSQSLGTNLINATVTELTKAA